MSIFKSNSPKDHQSAYDTQGYNPNKRITVYEDNYRKVTVPEGTPQEDIDAIVQAIKGKTKNKINNII